jgi:hypothetical protein
LHIAAIALTYILVTSGFDWFYFIHTRSSFLYVLFIPSALIGFFVPILTPVILLFMGTWRKNKKLLDFGYALGQSVAIAWLVSAGYKALTGRAHPAVFGAATYPPPDISRIFHFGFFRGGVFWGWPSSHTMVAFAVAATAITMVPNTKMKIVALAFTLYVGIGVSLTIHWFSDFAAGAILGTLVGTVVGAAFQTQGK